MQYAVRYHAVSVMSNSTQSARPASQAITIWLAAILALVASIVLVGGLTRLTESGLSITEWKPVSGIIPPLSEADWQVELEKYRSTTQYQVLNKGMALDQFKTIFWWEWGHRVLARVIGLAVLIPLMFFWLTGRLGGRELRDSLILFGLVCAQGLMGWLMVVSGLVGRLEVSQYRLAAHLGLAFVIFAWTLRMLMHRLQPAVGGKADRPAMWLAGLVFVQILLGALVAGLDAGLTYTTWPMMDGKLVPDGLMTMQPWWANFGENITTIQFQHRMAAYLIVAVAMIVALRAMRREVAAGSAMAVLGVTCVQVVLGIVTLLAGADGVQPIALGAMHQLGALALFAVSIVHVHQTRATQGRPSHLPLQFAAPAKT
jgi:cytochrome c oxidase assembly protein subunit 15